MGLASLINWKTEKEHFHYAPFLSELARVRQSHINLVIHQRMPSVALKQAVQTILTSSFKGFELTTIITSEVTSQLEKAFLQASILPLYELKELVEDMQQLIYQFATIIEAPHVRVHLKTVTNDACSKFHIDGYDLRLLCTYYGLGTEWTYNDNVNRKYLGEGENDQIIKDWSYINRVSSFDVAILKGEIPNRRTGKGIVHRSPPIEHRGEKRLLLRIDY